MLKEDLDWLEMVVSDPTGITVERFLSIRGFLIHAANAYDHLRPYMKGVHLTADGWRKNRNAEGWRDDKAGLVSFLAPAALSQWWVQ